MSDKPSTSSKSTSSVTRKSVENLRNVELIGTTSHQITGAKLPSNRQLLQVMFYNMRFVNLKARPRAKLAIDAAEIFWHQARIPIRKDDKSVEKLIKLYEKWKNIQKTIPSKRSDAQKQAADSFGECLDDLFGIAAAVALETIKINEDREFLEKQRQKGRPGCMIGVDFTLHEQEKRAEKRHDREEMLKRKHDEEMSRQFGNSSL